MKIAFFKLKPWEEEYLKSHKGLNALDAEVLYYDHILDKDHMPDAKDIDILSVFVDSVVSKEVLAALPDVKFIATRSTGYDHIDFGASRDRNIPVSTVPAYGMHTVAEYTFALLLCLSRKIYDAYNQVRETGSFVQEPLQGFDLNGKTLGVVGTGKIGKNVIRIAKGFEMNVIASDPYPDKEYAKEMGFTYKKLPEVLREADIITLHVPYMKSTHHLLNSDTIAHVKKGAYIINTSRGQVIETDALVRALKEGTVAGAGLDVLEEEGVIKDELSFLVSGHPEEHNLKTVLENHALIDLPNVIVTPHNAFNTKEALIRILDTTVENIEKYREGSPQNLAT